MGNYRVPVPSNEPVYTYAPGTTEREQLTKALGELKKTKFDIPMVIGGQDIRVGTPVKITAPHNHALELGQYYQGGKNEVQGAIDAALRSRPMWAAFPWEERAAIFLKAADLLAGPYRYIMNAATMLGHSKNVFPV